MVMPYLVADQAQVTVLRSLASAAFGKYSLTVPEGIKLEDLHTFQAPGNELGYVAGLGRKRCGGLARRFVRADVSVTAANPNDPAWVPDSTVDTVLAEAQSRVSGDFFLESDISKAGLGPWVPLVDFAVGDKVRVEIWGRVVVLPVTRIEPIISEHSIVDWRVHVGGQIVSDEQARLAENEVIRKALVEDRRDLAGLEAQVGRAVADSSEAKADASAALDLAAEAKAAVDGLDLTKLHADIEAALKAAEEARAAGLEHVARAQEEAAKAIVAAGDALSEAERAKQLADQADAVLDELAPMRDEVIKNLGEVRLLSAQIKIDVSSGRAFVASAVSHASLAINAADQADKLVAESRTLNLQAAVYVTQAQQAAKDGAVHVANAQAEAAKSATSAKSALDAAAEALRLVGLSEAETKKAQDAVAAAAELNVQMGQKVAEVSGFVTQAQQAQAYAAEHVTDAQKALSDTQAIRDQITVEQAKLMLQLQAGAGHVAVAVAHSGLAIQAADEADRLVGESRSLTLQAQGYVTQAQTAKDQAATALSSAQDVLTDVEATGAGGGR